MKRSLTEQERQLLREFEQGEWVEMNLSAADRRRYADAAGETLFDLDDAQRAELDRRWQAHCEDPSSAVKWDDVLRSLRSEE